MSEAESLVAKPESQWRSGKPCSKREQGARRNGTRQWKALWVVETTGVGALVAEAVLVLFGEATRSPSRWDDKSVCGQPHQALGGRQRPQESLLKTSNPNRVRWLAAAGGRSTDCVATQGWKRRQRSTSVATDGNLQAPALARRQEFEAGCGGRKGESPKLGS